MSCLEINDYETFWIDIKYRYCDTRPSPPILRWTLKPLSNKNTFFIK